MTMILVVDANIIFSAIIKSGNTKFLLLLLDNELYSPDYFFEEFEKHLQELCERTGLNEEQIKQALETLIEIAGIKFVALEKFIPERELAKEISGDPNDASYFGLAIFLNCPIWSNDKRLKKQNKVRIITTKELIEELNNEEN
ncbi:MAG: PIN domain-containing protein [archaeon]|nr:PIN domain-containing protein [archaeon]